MITVKPFKQDTRDYYTAAHGLPSMKILSVAFDKSGKAWVGTDKGAAVLEKGRFVAKRAYKGAVQLIYRDNSGRLWLACGEKLSTADGEYAYTFSDAVVAMAEDNSGNLRIITKSELYTFKNGDFKKYINTEGVPSDMTAFGDGEVYTACGKSLQTVFGKRPRWFEVNSTNSGLPDASVNAVAGDKFGMLWVGTSEGLWVYDAGSYWISKKQVPALTSYNVKNILIGKSGKRYVGTDIGLVIYDGAIEHFYGKGRWLPDHAVTAVAETDDGNTVLVGTENGLVIINTQTVTLAQKAEHFQQMTETYNIREGYCALRNLTDKFDIASGKVAITDNDGLWTGCYGLAQTYRYAATKDGEALELARRSMKAMLKLMKISGIPGFTARAYRREGETGFGNGNPEWHLTADEKGALEWKGETSSDEMVGHFVFSAMYYDYCADESEKGEVRQAVCAIVDHMLSHGYRLCDADGLPTTWANWNPDDLNRSDRWYWEHPVNSFEMLCFLKIAYHMSGDEKYQNEYLRLIKTEHYAINTMYRKRKDAHTCHIDDNLLFLSSIPLLEYETDPDLRLCYIIGMKDHWEYERIEANPVWNIVYGALTGESCDIDAAINTMKDMPYYPMETDAYNSLRNDLEWTDAGVEFGYGPQLAKPLPYDQRPAQRFASNHFTADREPGYDRLYDGTGFLLPYWLGRFYGLIGE